MKFYKGDIVLVEARVEEDVPDNFLLCSLNTNTRTFHQESFNAEIKHVHPFKTKTYDDNMSYDSGANDAWELARKIVLSENDGGYSSQEMREIFGDDYCNTAVLKDKTFEQTAYLVSEWKKRTFHVGDLVRIGPFDKGVITATNDNTCHILWSDGTTECADKSALTKIGVLGNTLEFLGQIEEGGDA